jgi:catechol 1,2-dioxygenase
MSDAAKQNSQNPRLVEVFDKLLDNLRHFIRENRITHDEYRQAVAFMTEVGQKREVSLLCDVFVEVTVDEVDNNGRAGTTTTIEGPFYVPDAPTLKSPCVLPHRPDEPGPVLYFSGTIRSFDGSALAGAVLDLWQSDRNGRYSHFDIPQTEAPFNLRARVITDHSGKFEVQTRLPGPYEIPKAGPTGALLAAMGRHAWRPAHLHMKVEGEGYRTLTTQLFLKKDPWIDSDVVKGAVKKGLIVDPVKHDDPKELSQKSTSAPYYTLSYDFVLEPSMAKAAQ